MASADDIVIPKILSFTKTWHNKAYHSISPTRPELSAAGKNVLVTGGGSGIGKAIATAFSRAGAASVAILGRRENRLKVAAAASGHKTKVLYKVADLTIRADVETAFKDIVKEVGKISILVSNAGTIATMGLMADTNANDLHERLRHESSHCVEHYASLYPLGSSQCHPHKHLDRNGGFCTNAWYVVLHSDKSCHYGNGRLYRRRKPKFARFQSATWCREYGDERGNLDERARRWYVHLNDPCVCLLIGCEHSDCQLRSVSGSALPRQASSRASSCGQIGTSRS